MLFECKWIMLLVDTKLKIKRNLLGLNRIYAELSSRRMSKYLQKQEGEHRKTKQPKQLTDTGL